MDESITSVILVSQNMLRSGNYEQKKSAIAQVIVIQTTEAFTSELA
jgi:hypothetical protein